MFTNEDSETIFKPRRRLNETQFICGMGRNIKVNLPRKESANPEPENYDFYHWKVHRTRGKTCFSHYVISYLKLYTHFTGISMYIACLRG